MMNRRTFLCGLTLGTLSALHAAEAQTAVKVPRIGVLRETSPTDPLLAAFRQGLRELGYTEGQNIFIEYRYARGVVDQIPTLAAELIGLNVDVLVVGGTAAARAAMARTSTIPIVFTLSGDPVGTGLLASLARPSGKATGLSNLVSELSGKQLELLKTALPQVSRVAVLYNPASPVVGPALNDTRKAARALSVELHVVEVCQPNELASAFAALTAWRAGAVLALSDWVFGNTLSELAQVAAENRLPAIYARREFVEVGGLLAYGPSFTDNWRRAATFVDKFSRVRSLPIFQWSSPPNSSWSSISRPPRRWARLFRRRC